jgi:hypothetical protein
MRALQKIIMAELVKKNSRDFYSTAGSVVYFQKRLHWALSEVY